MTIHETSLTKAFIEGIDASWPQGIPYVVEALQHGLIHHSQAWEDMEGRPLWAWGVVPMWEGVGSVWLLFDKRAHRYIFRIVREAHRFMGSLKDSGFKRLQGEFHEDAPTKRFAELMGFDREGILRNYGLKGNGDYIMVSRIF